MADYQAYEIVQGACLEDVEGICRHLTQDGSFTAATVPDAPDVHRHLTLAHHKIAALLAQYGLSAAQTDETVLGVLQWLNALEVAIWAELNNPITGVGEPNERFIALQGERDAIVEMIAAGALGDLGGDTSGGGLSSDLLQATGVSLSRKRTVESDTDLVQSRFKRGFGSNPRGGNIIYGETDWFERS